MAKIVKKTYGKKLAWGNGSCPAFDEARTQSKKPSGIKVLRPSIWAKVPLIETFTESPPRSKKKVSIVSSAASFPESVNEHVPQKKGRKRKIEDPFGFGDLDEEVLPASEYISPKKKKNEDRTSAVKKKGVKSKNQSSKRDKELKDESNVYSEVSSTSSVSGSQQEKLSPMDESPGTLIAKFPPPVKDKKTKKSPSSSQSDVSPKKRGRPPKDKSLEKPSPRLNSGNRGKIPKKSPSSSSNDASPRKRGRPPKDKTLSTPSPKLKFGSKEKGSKKTLASSGDATSPKKRGRPSKDKSIEAPSPKLKLGGKEKDSKKSPASSKVDSSPKKRGRPPKDQSLATPSPKIANSSQNNSLKKAAKISKGVISPKKLGRPPKQSIISSASQKIVSQDNTSPKKRGRPPKDKSLTTSSIVKDSPSSSGSISSPEKHVSLPKIGSPSQRSSDSQSTPRKRGRPPKIKTESPVTILSESPGISLEASTSATDSEIDNKSPKRRGRPRKAVRNDSGTLNEKMTPNTSPAVKELFIESNLKVENKNDQEKLSVNSQDVIDVIDVAPLVKRRRGRPPKEKAVKDAQEPLLSSSEAQSDEIKNTKDETNLALPGIDSVEVSEDEAHNQFISPTEAEMLAEQTTQEMTPKKVRFSSENDDGPSKRESSSTDTGSPFKWFMKNNKKTLSPRKVAKLRRISVLPTCSTEGDDDEEDMNADMPFGLPWGIERDDNALRVTKDDKELFTIVRNTKQAQESVEFGESQQFKDDVEYLLDGITNTNSLSTRCLSLIELASKCSKTAFRMNLRAHGTIAAIFEKLSDAPSNQRLALCTAAVMFMLTRDRLSIDFDKSILEMMLKLLAMKEDEEEESSKDWNRLTTKINDIFGKHPIKGVNNLDLAKLTTESLARESFLSLTLQRTGSWFKDEIRLLGGLDHIVDTVVSCSKCLKVNGKSTATDSVTIVRQIERCLKLLENVTVQCPSNQGYLVSYRDSALLESCARLLKFSVASLFENEQDSATAVQALWFSTMKMLLNLTHDNELASAQFCQKNDVLGLLLKTALQCPTYLPTPKQFDVAVLSLGLIINLVEYSEKNLAALNAVIAPAFRKCSPAEKEAQSKPEEASATDSLLHLFLVKLEAAKENSGMEEDLSKLDNSLHNSSIRIGSDGISLVCGDNLEKSQNETSSTEEAADEGDAEEKPSSTEKEAEKEAEHISKALQKAGQHMEDSLIASYAALLLGLLAENNKENQQAIHERLQYGDFGVMTHTLEKFLAFMNMTASTSNSSSSLVIKRAIATLEKCKTEYPPKLPES